ncbi:hypothetical protein AU193_08080 [Mycobacterium sp. GA-1285]|nr:hypothetical protein AU193_08080 [Mycobacterium sp. GA-1285]
MICVIGAGNPSFWYDEAATMSATGRSLAELAKLIATSDAAHPLYYLLMHGWFEIAPRTEFWARVPSSIAIGFAAAGLVVLARLLSNRALGISAGLVFAILPRVTWAGIEARPYALTCVASIWLTVLLVVAARRGRSWLWAAYAGLFAVSVLLHIHLAMIALVHLAVVVVLRLPRSTMIRWVAATGTAVAVLIPYLAFLSGQTSQLAWIEPLSLETLAHVFGTQYFDRSIPFAAIAALVVVLSFAIPRYRRQWRTVPGSLEVVAISALWIVLPTGFILVASAILQPLYADRYLTFTAPAAALGIGMCVVVLGRNARGIAIICALLAVAAVPNYIWQRSDYAKAKMDYSQVADLISAHASPGDCLLLDDTVDWRPGPIRPLAHARPAAYAGLVDVGLGRPAEEAGQLWDSNLAPFQVVDRIAKCDVIWTISQKDPTLPSHEAGIALPPGPRFTTANAFWVPRDLGFRLVERWQFNISQVIKAIR